MITRIILYADEGKVLTNGKIYGKQIFLSDTESPNNYREISQADYDVLSAEEENDANI